jgi:hypothetical protein
VGGGCVLNLLLEVTVKEENSQDFCPNYVQEFGLGIVEVAQTGQPLPYVSGVENDIKTCSREFQPSAWHQHLGL